MPGTHNPSALLEAALNGNLDLDTGAERQPESHGADDASTDTTNTQTALSGTDAATAAAGAQDNGTQEDEKPAPIASKSGGYTIPYEKLVEARTDRDQWKQRAAELQEQLQQLTAQQQNNLQQAQQDAQARADAGETATTADQNLAIAQAAIADGVDMNLFGDFSEEAIANGIAKLVDMRVQNALAPMVAERAKSAQKAAEDAHYNAIYSAHQDADEIVESEQWSKWLQGMPAFMRAATEQTLKAGSAAQVIEVFDTFKQQTGVAGGKSNVRAMLQQAQNNPPFTLTDVPGGLADKSTAEQLSVANDPSSLLSLMEGKTPEQIEQLMNSVL